MANTHDFVIANDTGANVRADLNVVLAQLKATNAGSSAPSSTAEGMLWWDTTNDIIKVYNGSAWVSVIKAVSSGSPQALGTGDTVTHANLANISGTVQGVGQGNTPTFAGMVIADGSNDLNIASHDGTNGLKLAGTLVTASATELNLLDGVTNLATQAELDAVATTATTSAQGVGTGDSPTFAGGTFNGNVSVADGTNTLNIISHDGATGGLKLENVLVTATAGELNILDGVTATTTELNLMDGCTASTAELNTMNGITSTTAELNLLDGVTATTTELNIMDGVTASTAELNIMDGVTATTAELNVMDGVTATTAELNILDGVTANATELNLLDGVTSLGSNGNLPLGGIMALASGMSGAHAVPNSGAVDSSGWMLCDGSTIPANQGLSGTLPDLTDGRFLQGNTHANVGGTGGNTIPAHTHTGPSHTHTGPSHTHSFSGSASHSHTVNNHNHAVYIESNGSYNRYQGTYGAQTSGLHPWNHTSGGSAPGTNSQTVSISGTTGAEGTGNTGASGTGATSDGSSHASVSGSDVLPKYLRVVYLMRVI